MAKPNPRIKKLVSADRDWAAKTRALVFDANSADLEQILQSSHDDRRSLLIGSRLNSMGNWLLANGRSMVVERPDEGWKQLALGYDLKKTALIGNVWPRFRDASRNPFATRSDLASLMVFGWFVGEDETERFCSRLATSAYLQFDYAGETSELLLALMARHAKSNPWVNDLPPLQTRLFSSWGSRSFKSALMEYLEYREMVATEHVDTIDSHELRSGLLANMPVEVLWMLRLRRQDRLAVPRIDHWFVKENPLLELPRNGFPQQPHVLAARASVVLRENCVKAKSLFDLKIPRL